MNNKIPPIVRPKKQKQKQKTAKEGAGLLNHSELK